MPSVLTAERERSLECASCPEMVVIPAGEFIMGSDHGNEDEKPVHKVTSPGLLRSARSA
jgi:formylglycine-generating enzyme required for sulfatase activity